MNCGHYTLRKDRVCFEITMELLLKSFSVFLLFCVNVNDGKMFRRDYEWSDKAGGWLKYHAVPTTWNNARMRCEAEGATLASPLTNDLKAGIVSFLQMKTDPENYVFSGVHSIFSDGVYTSIEGVPLSRLAVTWEEHEPDNDDDAERCLAMRVASQGAMADVRCETLLSYVCYRPDTNLTINYCGTIDPEYIMDIRTGSSYKFHRQGVSWSQAFMTCDAEGGYLAIINDESEASFIKKFIKTESEKPIHAQFINSVFVGFHDWGTFGSSFKTIHGENMESLYYRWARGQPDNSTIKDFGADLGEFCGSVTMEDVLLNDSYCDSKLTFLCEKEPSSLM